MDKPRLILVEGIPGSGKTTTARYIARWLENHGQRPALYLEGNWDHPADFEAVACLNKVEFAAIQQQFPAQAALLVNQAWHEAGDWFLQYRKLQHEHPAEVPAALGEALASFDIYELPEAAHRSLLLRRWKQFATRAAGEDRVYVFECAFLQNPTTTLLAKHNLSIETIGEHIAALGEIVRPLQPRLVYLAVDDPEAVLDAARHLRSPEWLEFVTRYLTGQGYGLAHQLRGFDGVAAFYRIRQALELELVSGLPVPSLVMADLLDWSQRYATLETFLSW